LLSFESLFVQGQVSSLSNNTRLPQAYSTWLLQYGSNYDHFKYFGDNDEVALHWKISGGKIHIAAAVEASGWLGIGLAEAGGMPGADMVLFTAADNALVDAYSSDYTAPTEDKCQDWTLDRSSVDTDNGFIIFEATRDLVTEDPQDRAIMNDADTSTPSQRIIVAYGNTDSVSYHGTNVGLGTVRFFAPSNSTTEVSRSGADGDGVRVVEFTAGNYTIPTNETTYGHFCFNISDLAAQGFPQNSTVHGIKAQYIPDSDSHHYVHHIILYGSVSENDCEQAFTPLYVWAPGAEDFIMPENVGMSIGTAGFKTLKLEIHYNNPEGVAGVVDNSGARLFYTSALRQYDAGIFQVGDPLVSLVGVPVGEGWQEWNFTCPGSCTEQYFGDQNLTVFSEYLHMHGTGKRMVNSQFRDDVVIREGYVDFYDFQMAGGVAVRQSPFQVKSGDSFKVRCYYDSDQNKNTLFGYGSQDEMCISFLWYYPAVPQFYGLCGANIYFDPACNGTFAGQSLSGEEELGRVFGSELDSCVDRTETDSATTTSGSITLDLFLSIFVGLLASLVTIEVF